MTFPVSLTSPRVAGVSDVGGFVRKLGIGALVPGVELELPVGARGLLAAVCRDRRRQGDDGS